MAEVTAEERTSISAFCNNNRLLLQNTKKLKEVKKNAALQKKRYRDEIYKIMKVNNTPSMIVNNNLLKVRSYTNRKALTKDIITEAVLALTDKFVRSCDVVGDKCIRNTVLTAVTKAIANRREDSREYVAITKKKKSNAGANHSPGSKMVELIAKYRETEKLMADTSSQIRAIQKPLQDRINDEKRNVKEFMNRSMIQSQRVNIALEGGMSQTYFIRRKKRKTKKRLSEEQISDLIRKAILSSIDFTELRTTTQAIAAIKFKADGISNSIIKLLESIPKDVTETISLDRGSIATKT